jgi:hypothetical protein
MLLGPEEIPRAVGLDRAPNLSTRFSYFADDIVISVAVYRDSRPRKAPPSKRRAVGNARG